MPPSLCSPKSFPQYNFSDYLIMYIIATSDRNKPPSDKCVWIFPTLGNQIWTLQIQCGPVGHEQCTQQFSDSVELTKKVIDVEGTPSRVSFNINTFISIRIYKVSFRMIGTQTTQAQRSVVYQCVPSHHLKIKGKRCLLKHKQTCSNERLE